MKLSRRIAEEVDTTELETLAEMVRYSGSPYHKRNPGDFGLTPPSSPRRDKTLCDGVGIFTTDEALRLLRMGINTGLVSEQRRGQFPQNVWSVTDKGMPVEAQLENRDQGVYHGYPLLRIDPLYEEVLRRWNVT